MVIAAVFLGVKFQRKYVLFMIVSMQYICITGYRWTEFINQCEKMCRSITASTALYKFKRVSVWMKDQGIRYCCAVASPERCSIFRCTDSFRPWTVIELRVICSTLSSGVQPSLSPFERFDFERLRAIYTKINIDIFKLNNSGCFFRENEIYNRLA